ncbi:hypothetical protein BU26DRAFT_499119 [Trematosphaeria pertusa]|uniref:Cytochrome P450 n=1 Tax=Trematosphaeria pertusa TaxID=390896 RepID=A0A6A6J283_9PLEO|nr:uncharacterized protein BU26DRAFT_499119 [Trematosphaeria pertusa]KAF2256457.1 hypothetical protein BU26DRAFT_499119 [Trematosphaeria pertusa]
MPRAFIILQYQAKAPEVPREKKTHQREFLTPLHHASTASHYCHVYSRVHHLKTYRLPLALRVPPHSALLHSLFQLTIASLFDLFPNPDMDGLLTVVWPLSFIAYWALWITYARSWHSLARIPGPLWPSVSRTWLMYRMYIRDLEIMQRALYEKYIPLLRTAPDEVLIGNPEAISQIYPI